MQCMVWNLAGLLFYATPAEKSWAERLGYPSGKRVSILHANDMGMCYEANAAIQRALGQGDYRSAAVMVPCEEAQGIRGCRDRSSLKSRGEWSF
jgi:hypothetical protein